MKTSLERRDDYWHGTFDAMASTCDVLIDAETKKDANAALKAAADEAGRIEAKFSRYRDDNIVHEINNSGGKPVRVDDDETAGLLDFAEHCWRLSGGRFDITSGVLRRVWRFDGSDNVPSADQVDVVLSHVGWQHVSWQKPWFKLPAGMEIDLGGFGKEYAVDRALQLAAETGAGPVLVNLGGDLAASGARRNDTPWQAGIEDPSAGGEAVRVVPLERGALATSGDAQRFLLKDGVRYSHILDPTTGWPVADAPRSVTVHAANCTEAGLLATLAMLEGAGAEAFLEAQGAQYWCVR